MLLLISFNSFASPDTVEMVDNEFIPDTITITEGDTIVWVNNGTVVHTSTSGTNCTPDNIWNSGNVAVGESYLFNYNTAGEFPYYCIPHCGAGMTGHITVESQPTGIKEPEIIANVEVFPNPVHDIFEVKIESQHEGTVQMVVYDLNGKKVLEREASSQGKTTVDVSSLQSGLYILKISQDDAVAVKKFTKQ